MKSEKKVVKKFTQNVKKVGGLPIKLSSDWFSGLPDYLVLAAWRRIWFAEIKNSEGGRLSARQVLVQKMLRAMGFPVYVISTDEDIVNFTNEIENGNL